MTSALSEKIQPSFPSYGDIEGAAVSSPASDQEEATHLAHDARNWLTTLQIYCDLLRTSGAVKTGYERWMEELSGSVERGQDLVASLLESLETAEQKNSAAVAKTENDASSETAPMPRGVDLNQILARRQPLWQHMAGDRIRVEIDAPMNLGKARMGESALERILTNLVQNAMEAMPDGGRLRISARRGCRPVRRTERNDSPTNTLLLRVIDTGHGIAAEDRTRIFEAGVSGKAGFGKTGRKERAGIHGYGLAIVRELTERAGGAVRVRSRPGRGSCFEVKLPKAR